MLLPFVRYSKRWRARHQRCAARTGISTRQATRSALRHRMSANARTIVELARALRARELSSETVTTECLARIADRNPSVNAFIAVLADQALAQARDADAELARGQDRGPLHGVPLSLKDIIDLRGVATTAASRVREGHVAAGDSLVA